MYAARIETALDTFNGDPIPEVVHMSLADEESEALQLAVINGSQDEERHDALFMVAPSNIMAKGQESVKQPPTRTPTYLFGVYETGSDYGTPQNPIVNALFGKKDTGIGFNALELDQEINRFVVGQETGVKKLATTFFDHYSQFLEYINAPHMQSRIEKPTTLLYGPLGSGGTYTVSTMAEALNLNFLEVDCGILATTGIDGASMERIINDLVKLAGGNKLRTQQSVLLLNNFHALRDDGYSRTEGSENVQRTFMKLMGGATYDLNRVKTEWVMSSEPILTIANGSFTGVMTPDGEDLLPSLYTIIKERLGETSNRIIGFDPRAELHPEVNPDYNTVMAQMRPEDLQKYGFHEELAEFFDRIVMFRELQQEDYLHLLKGDLEGRTPFAEPLWERTVSRFMASGVNLELTEEAQQFLVHTAAEAKKGPKRLGRLIKEVTDPELYAISEESRVISLDLNTVQQRLQAIHTQ